MASMSNAAELMYKTPGGVRHEIQPIRMRYLQSDFRAWKEPLSELYMLNITLYSNHSRLIDYAWKRNNR